MLHRGISTRQPWAVLILEGLKPIENRHFGIEPNTRVLIHVAKSKTSLNPELWGDATYRAMVGLAKRRGLSLDELRKSLEPSLGLVCGSVFVTRVAPSKSPWADPGSKHWHLCEPRILRNPFPWKGQTSLLNIETRRPLTYV